MIKGQYILFVLRTGEPVPVPSPHFFGRSESRVVLGLRQICMMGNISKWPNCTRSCLCCGNILWLGRVSTARFSHRIKGIQAALKLLSREGFCGDRSTFGALPRMIKEKKNKKQKTTPRACWWNAADGSNVQRKRGPRFISGSLWAQRLHPSSHRLPGPRAAKCLHFTGLDFNSPQPICQQVFKIKNQTGSFKAECLYKFKRTSLRSWHYKKIIWKEGAGDIKTHLLGKRMSSWLHFSNIFKAPGPAIKKVKQINFMAFKKQYFMDSCLFEKDQYSSLWCCLLHKFITYFVQKSIIIFCKIGQVLQTSVKYYWHVLGRLWHNFWRYLTQNEETKRNSPFDATQKTFSREVSEGIHTPSFHAVPAHSVFCQINNSGLHLATCTGAVQDPASCYTHV